MGLPGRRSLAVAAVVLAALLPVVVGAMLATPAGQAWSGAVVDVVDEVEPLLRSLLRGGLRLLSTPFVVAVVAWCLVRMLRAGRRRAALIVFVVALGSFLTSEAIKLELLPFPAFGSDASHDLSGHVAMVAAALMVVAVATPPRSRTPILALAWLLVVGTGLGVILAGWHDAGEVVVPASVALTWAVAGWAVAGWADAGTRGLVGGRPGRRRLPERAIEVVTVGCAVVAVALVSAADARMAPLPALLAAVLAVAGSATALATAARALATALDRPLVSA